jgi:hypothetical protein
MPSAPPPLDSDGLFPWRYFVQAMAGVFRLRVVLLAAAGVWMAATGDMALHKFFGEADPEEIALVAQPTLHGRAESSLLGPIRYWQSIVQPFLEAWQTGRADLAAFGLWRLAIWVLLGGAIARVAACHLTLREAPGLGVALRESARLWWLRIVSLLGLLLIAAALLLPLVFHRWMMGVAGLDMLSSLLLPIPLLSALAAAAILVCLAINWPLVIASPAIERPDPFDMASGAFAFVTQRPVQLAAYGVTALAVALPVDLLVELVTHVLMQLSAVVLGPHAAEGVAQFWLAHLVLALPDIFYAAYFWTAVVAIYLLLRRDVDGREVDEIFQQSP